MNQTIIIFVTLSLLFVYISRHPLRNYKRHGFYRFFGWEGLAWVFANNYSYWFRDPLSIQQIISWCLLLSSFTLALSGLWIMFRKGKASKLRNEKELFHFERTTRLIQEGAYKHIRHPLYASLTYLTWGILLKQMTIILLLVTIFSTVLFYITMRIEEEESKAYFGKAYKEYMQKTKRFIPFIF